MFGHFWTPTVGLNVWFVWNFLSMEPAGVEYLARTPQNLSNTVWAYGVVVSKPRHLMAALQHHLTAASGFYVTRLGWWDVQSSSSSSSGSTVKQLTTKWIEWKDRLSSGSIGSPGNNQVEKANNNEYDVSLCLIAHMVWYCVISFLPVGSCWRAARTNWLKSVLWERAAGRSWLWRSYPFTTWASQTLPGTCLTRSPRMVLCLKMAFCKNGTIGFCFHMIHMYKTFCVHRCA